MSVTVHLATLDDLHVQQTTRSNEYQELIVDLSALCATKDDEVENERQHLIDFKKQVALEAVNSRSGKPIPPQVCQSFTRARFGFIGLYTVLRVVSMY